MANQIKKKYLSQEVIDYFDNQINSVESDVSALDGRLDTAESEIDTLQSDVTALDGRLDTAESEIDTLQSDVSALDGRLDTAESDINAIEAALPLKADLVGGLVPANQLPSYVDDVLEFNNLASFPVTGETGKIYVAKDTNKTYRWSGSAYIYITSGAVDSVFGRTGVVTAQSGDYNSDQVTEGSANLYYTSARQAAIEAYADQAEADAKTYADGLNSAMDLRVDALEAIEWATPFKKTLNGTDISNGYIDLPHEAVQTNGMSAYVDRLAIHQGEDYTLSVVGGVTRITFAGDLVSPGNQQLMSGDSIYVRYQRIV